MEGPVKRRDYGIRDKSEARLFVTAMLHGLPQAVWAKIITEHLHTIRDVKMVCSITKELYHWCPTDLYYRLLQKWYNLSDNELETLRLRYRYIKPEHLLALYPAIGHVIELQKDQPYDVLSTKIYSGGGDLFFFTTTDTIDVSLVIELLKTNFPWIKVDNVPVFDERKTSHDITGLNAFQREKASMLTAAWFLEQGYTFRDDQARTFRVRSCLNCGTDAVRVECSACGDASYCGERCAREHWDIKHFADCL